MKKIEIKITQRDKNACLLFAETCVGTNVKCYAGRGQTNQYKIINDIYIGKLAEIGVYKHLRSEGLKPSKPDFEIYGGKAKSFQADISCKNKRFHVKGQTEESARAYGKSYLLQKEDPLVKRESTNIDILVPCMVTEDTVEIYGYIHMEDIPKEYLKAPRIEWLAKTKVAIYLDDILELTIRKRWRGLC